MQICTHWAVHGKTEQLRLDRTSGDSSVQPPASNCSETDPRGKNSLEKLCGYYWGQKHHLQVCNKWYAGLKDLFLKGVKKKKLYIWSIYSWIIHHDSSNPCDWAWMKSNDLNCSTLHLVHSTWCNNGVPSSAQLPGSGALTCLPAQAFHQESPKNPRATAWPNSGLKVSM